MNRAILPVLWRTPGTEHASYDAFASPCTVVRYRRAFRLIAQRHEKDEP
jgi:hypothetical protein